MAENANNVEYLYYKLRAGNPNHPLLKTLRPQLNLAAQRRLQVLEKQTVNAEGDDMHEKQYVMPSTNKKTLANQSNAHKSMMDKSKVDL